MSLPDLDIISAGDEQKRFEAIRYIMTRLIEEKYNQERKMNLIQRENDLKSSIKALNIVSAKLKVIIQEAEKTQAESAESNLRRLEMKIDEKIEKVYPGDNFKVRFEPVEGKLGEYTLMIGKVGETFAPPTMQNGNLFRQIVNQIGVGELQKIFGCELKIMDEATNGGDIETTLLASQLVKDSICEGCQVILIEHKAQYYEALPRTQVELRRDKTSNKIVELKFKNLTGGVDDVDI